MSSVFLINWRSYPGVWKRLWLKWPFPKLTVSSLHRVWFYRCCFFCSRAGRALPSPLLLSTVWQVHGLPFLVLTVQGYAPHSFLWLCCSLSLGPCLEAALPRQKQPEGVFDWCTSLLYWWVSRLCTENKQLFPRSKAALSLVFYWGLKEQQRYYVLASLFAMGIRWHNKRERDWIRGRDFFCNLRSFEKWAFTPLQMVLI